MMQHIPVISSNIEGPNEIIRDGQTGFKVNVMENEEGERSILPEELAEKIKLLLNDPLLAKSITKNARIALKEQFSSVNMAKNIAAVYHKLIKKKHQKTGNPGSKHSERRGKTQVWRMIFRKNVARTDGFRHRLLASDSY